jgi:hypothetical protein
LRSLSDASLLCRHRETAQRSRRSRLARILWIASRPSGARNDETVIARHGRTFMAHGLLIVNTSAGKRKFVLRASALRSWRFRHHETAQRSWHFRHRETAQRSWHFRHRETA